MRPRLVETVKMGWDSPSASEDKRTTTESFAFPNYLGILPLPLTIASLDTTATLGKTRQR